MIDEAEYDPLALLPDGVITDLCALYDRPVRGAVAYMQNLNDSSHIERHLKPFMAQMHGDNEVYLLAEAWRQGHTPPPKSLLTATLESVTTMPTWSQGLTSVGFERVDPGGLRRIQAFGSSAASIATGRE
ncbi:hypothetical protein [Agrococcus sp. KRD186]|uniref:hypothetical protein n=1 Tax=Agrococcus sp. KRD186 TaxID=2729730 RepID=UPI0019CF7DBB|nr:hypothetical protein [Agrococcus sp. KRD186]